MEQPDLPLVLVEWLDANTDNEEINEENVHTFHKPWVIHTLGWLLKEDEVGVTICNEYYKDYYRGRTFIPRGMVVSMVPFRLAKYPKKKALQNTPSASESQPDIP